MAAPPSHEPGRAASYSGQPARRLGQRNRSRRGTTTARRCFAFKVSSVPLTIHRISAIEQETTGRRLTIGLISSSSAARDPSGLRLARGVVWDP
jgi:hypothetical protein